MFPVLAGSNPSGYNLTRSLRFRASASAYLNRTPASAGNRQTWTWSGWVKRGTQGTSQGIFAAATSGSALAELYFNTSNALSFYDYTGAYNLQLVTNQVFRDSSAWYHIVVALDTTNATAANRVKIYVNGAQVTALSTATYPSQNYQGYVNNNIAHYTSSYNGSTDLYDGYLTEVNFIDGQALTPSSFGSTNALTGVWQPARYTGTYGTNGFYLPFTDNSALTTSSNVGLGKDFSGNGNYWTTNNISITAGVTYDSMTDVPTLTSATAANFAVWNPVESNLMSTGSASITNGNLTVADNASSYGLYARGTVWVSSGKWYWEITCTSIGSIYANLGFCDASQNGVFYQSSGQRNPTATNTGTTSYGASYTTGDVIGVALDLTNLQVTFYKNNVSQGTVTGVAAALYAIAAGDGQGATQNTFNLNAGQRPFTYTPPTGFVALNTYNLPTSTILQGNKVMDATLYTGTGASLSVTNAASFKPDLVWVKGRSGATDHAWYDSVRGTTKQLESNTTTAETTEATGLTAFGSAGFTVGALAQMNTSAATYVGWQWQAGQGSSSSNTNGTITSTVSVNASAGFSIVVYTGNGTNGATVGHGLGVKPSLIIEKGRSTTYNWPVQGCGVLWPTATQTLFLNGTNALNPGSGVAAPTSSVFTPSATVYANESGVSNVAYCWTPIAGYSAFGSISANGAADNAFVYTGFLPRFVLLKRTDSTSNWIIWDTARNTFNVMGNDLYPNLSNAEASTVSLDIVSNGFKLRNSSFAGNWIYAAFASNPFKNSLAR